MRRTEPWTDAEVAILKSARIRPNGATPLPWAAFVPIGAHGKSDCLAKLRELTGETPSVAIKVSAVEPAVAMRDGLEWLRKKGRLTQTQLRAGLHYRETFRAAEIEGPALRSGLDVQEGQTSGHGSPVENMVLSRYDAKRRLFSIRHQILRGQDDMLTVMDGVCGQGLGVREMAGGPGVNLPAQQLRAAALEAVLCVALDLLAKDIEKDMAKVA